MSFAKKVKALNVSLFGASEEKTESQATTEVETTETEATTVEEVVPTQEEIIASLGEKVETLTAKLGEFESINASAVETIANYNEASNEMISLMGAMAEKMDEMETLTGSNHVPEVDKSDKNTAEQGASTPQGFMAQKMSELNKTNHK